MSALKDLQGLDSYEAACRFREQAEAHGDSASPPPHDENTPAAPIERLHSEDVEERHRDHS